MEDASGRASCGRVVCHDCGSGVDRAAVTIGDRGICALRTTGGSWQTTAGSRSLASPTDEQHERAGVRG